MTSIEKKQRDVTFDVIRAMYLFHRHFFLGLLIFYNFNSLGNIREATYPIWFAYLVVCPCIIIGSYCLQRIYDYAINRWWH